MPLALMLFGKPICSDMMKKNLLTLAAILLFIPARGQFRFGFQGGVNLTTLIERNYQHDYAENFYKVGFNAGPFAEFKVGKHLSLVTALILETKGTQGTVRLDTIAADLSTSLLYLDVPLLIRGNLKTGNFTCFMEAGPYAGFGLSGKATAKSGGKTISRDIRWGSGIDDDFTRLDLGGMAGAGVEWKHFFLEGTFMLGLANIYPVGEIDYNIHHRVFSLRVGYFL